MESPTPRYDPPIEKLAPFDTTLGNSSRFPSLEAVYATNLTPFANEFMGKNYDDTIGVKTTVKTQLDSLGNLYQRVVEAKTSLQEELLKRMQAEINFLGLKTNREGTLQEDMKSICEQYENLYKLDPVSYVEQVMKAKNMAVPEASQVLVEWAANQLAHLPSQQEAFFWMKNYEYIVEYYKSKYWHIYPRTDDYHDLAILRHHLGLFMSDVGKEEFEQNGGLVAVLEDIGLPPYDPKNPDSRLVFPSDVAQLTLALAYIRQHSQLNISRKSLENAIGFKPDDCVTILRHLQKLGFVMKRTSPIHRAELLIEIDQRPRWALSTNAKRESTIVPKLQEQVIREDSMIQVLATENGERVREKQPLVRVLTVQGVHRRPSIFIQNNISNP